jgi:hypothetical protein
MPASRILIKTCLLILVSFVPLTAQVRLGGLGGTQRANTSYQDDYVGEFTFSRAIYTSDYDGWRSQSWAIDFPEADEHFIIGIREWAGTNLKISSQPKQLRILDDSLFNYPFLYIVEPGYMSMSDEEGTRLREYLMRGGFLFLDDFWGDYEWEHVQNLMHRVLPDYKIVDLPPSHPIFHCYLDIEEVTQVPGIGSWMSRGVTHEKGGIVPHYMGIEDKNGRLLVFFTRNCDLGDAWEWIDDPRYPVKYGLVAYKIGINAVIYAMSH